ncbi:asparagine synthase-related protein [uncultured Chryseobacterium sp.]|uniref:asparagine synthase-related protein n=1 Tax=uncultured Chryseobacterium sp. TaxID=259322 RepID=UPI002582961E|nr:asparagine synthase-related protein [uncultured Chryseobacterium sp.]
MKEFKYYNHLGYHNPYFIKNGEKLLIDPDHQSILLQQENKTLDFAAIVEILSTGYAFGDRTLIKEIKKTPWMAKPNNSNNEWEFFEVPKHMEKNITENESAIHFYQLLEKELIDYVETHQHIGVLLTGGMDSRIVAAVLNNLIKSKRLTSKKVTAYTWGSDDSRDVVYAKRIADLFGWDWKHVNVDTVQMHKNYELIIENGCEYTPIHLHAMSKVALEKELDCVLAGSFGDSVGRGEYSGVKAKNLKSLKLKISNVAGLLRDDYIELSEQSIDGDLAYYHKKFPEDKEYQQNENDLQLHYMRRMLNPCMNIINKRIPLYQMFTSPEVFGYIWSINPDFRTDLIYKNLLEKYSPELLEIPWARTGLRYPEKEGEPDQYKKKHHDYGQMIRKDFLEIIDRKINEHKRIAQEIFNFKSLIQLIKNCRKYPVKGSFTYEEKLFWIAALLDFIHKNNIKIDLPQNRSNSFINTFKEDIKYKVKYFYKRIK